jgi:hypothetical protein
MILRWGCRSRKSRRCTARDSRIRSVEVQCKRAFPHSPELEEQDTYDRTVHATRYT